MYAPAGFLETSSRSLPSALISGDPLLMHEDTTFKANPRVDSLVPSQFRLARDSDTGNLVYVINLFFIMVYKPRFTRRYPPLYRPREDITMGRESLIRISTGNLGPKRSQTGQTCQPS